MNVLVTGATGFIGRHICACLLGRGYVVTGAARNVASLRRRFPRVNCVRIDMNRMLSPDDWSPLLPGLPATLASPGNPRRSQAPTAQAPPPTAPEAPFAPLPA